MFNCCVCYLLELVVFVKKLSDYSVESGKSIILESIYIGIFLILVIWKKDGFNIILFEKCNIVIIEKICFLEILNSIKRDVG